MSMKLSKNKGRVYMGTRYVEKNTTQHDFLKKLSKGGWMSAEGLWGSKTYTHISGEKKSTSRLVGPYASKLLQNGLIIEKKDPRDKRKKIYKITEKGKKLLKLFKN